MWCLIHCASRLGLPSTIKNTSSTYSLIERHTSWLLLINYRNINVLEDQARQRWVLRPSPLKKEAGQSSRESGPKRVWGRVAVKSRPTPKAKQEQFPHQTVLKTFLTVVCRSSRLLEWVQLGRVCGGKQRATRLFIEWRKSRRSSPRSTRVACILRRRVPWWRWGALSTLRRLLRVDDCSPKKLWQWLCWALTTTTKFRDWACRWLSGL